MSGFENLGLCYSSFTIKFESEVRELVANHLLLRYRLAIKCLFITDLLKIFFLRISFRNNSTISGPKKEALYLLQQQMHSCQLCKTHIQKLKSQAQQLICGQKQLTQLNDTLIQELNGGTLIQENHHWKARCEEIVKLTMQLQRKCKVMRQQVGNGKQNGGNLDSRSRGNSVIRSQSITKMQAFLKKVAKSSSEKCEPNCHSKLRL